MTQDWMVLIYTVPSQPTRKRAYVWRELKRLGAVYLRDGVALLPRRPDIESHLVTIAERIQEYEGSRHLLLSPHFEGDDETALVGRFQEERLAEYRELYHACVRFLRDVVAEADAEEFGFPDVDNLESELGRLRRWSEQIKARDYFGAPGAERTETILEKCSRAFEGFAADASIRAAMPEDDVFERLGGHTLPGDAATEDYPL